MTKKIIVDGREFSSVEEMPPDVRRRYEQAMSALADRDGDGVPDIMQSGLPGIEDLGDGYHKVEVETRNEYLVDGEEYSSLDEMPPEAREMIGRMMRDMPADDGSGGVHTFETEIISGDEPGIRASGTRRIVQRSGMRPSPSLTGGESPSRGRLGWFVALILGLALIWVLMSGCSPQVESPDEQGPPPYSIPGTEVHTVTSETIGHDFQIIVALPASYGSSDIRYPVVYSLDANIGFGMAVDIARVLAFGEEVPEVISVGIGYGPVPMADWSWMRQRDYTPTHVAEWDEMMRGESQEAPEVLSGGAGTLLAFLREEVFPFVESTYLTEPEQSGFFGDSYGGLFALYTLFHAPETFSRYIVGSPSIWWDDRVTLEYEAAYAAENSDLPAKIFMSVGLLEEDPDVPELVDAAMVTNVRELDTLLRGREYPSLEIHTQFFPDETHLSVVTSNFSRGLRTLYPPTASGG